jgi:hypothetical protein
MTYATPTLAFVNANERVIGAIKLHHEFNLVDSKEALNRAFDEFKEVCTDVTYFKEVERAIAMVQLDHKFKLAISKEDAENAISRLSRY